jgi:hypothetical protein
VTASIVEDLFGGIAGAAGHSHRDVGSGLRPNVGHGSGGVHARRRRDVEQVDTPVKRPSILTGNGERGVGALGKVGRDENLLLPGRMVISVSHHEGS